MLVKRRTPIASKSESLGTHAPGTCRWRLWPSLVLNLGGKGVVKSLGQVENYPVQAISLRSGGVAYAELDNLFI